MKTTTTRKFTLIRTALAMVAAFSLTIAGITNLFSSSVVAAAVPATVSADPLPTAQIDGIVWAQVIVGNTVYATGHFSTARPAGVARGGAGTVTRVNLMAYDITTGKLSTTFVHSLTAGNDSHDGGRSIAVSPDHKTLYVGGKFSAADGQAHANIAAFDLTTNKVKTGFQGVSSTVLALSANNAGIYLGGTFGTVGSLTRSHLANFNLAGTLTGWAPTTNGVVEALIISPDNSKVIIGGAFDQLSGRPYYGMGAVTSGGAGTPVAWASQSSSFPIRDTDPAGSGASITSFSTNGNLVFLTAFNFTTTTKPGGFEGRAAMSPADGHLVWMNDCHGDSYGAIPIGNVLYSVSHEHDCSAIGGFHEQSPRINMHAEAETLTVDGKDVQSDENYTSYAGQPRSTQLEWYPVLNIGTVSGASQAAWSITGNSSYVALGGEFTTANGMPQQGLVRYGVRSLAPNKIGPTAYKKYGVVQHGVNAAGQAVVTMTTTSDPDDLNLIYRLYRDGNPHPIYTATVASHYLVPSTVNFTDSGLKPGSSHNYGLTASDPYGHTVSTYNLTDDTNPQVSYSANGAWVTTTAGARQGDYFQGIHYTKVNGATATLHFTGTAVAIVTERNTDRGNVSIKIDGATPVTVNLHSTSFLPQQTIFTKTGLVRGNHTVSITKQSGTYMDVDGFHLTN